MAQARDQDHQQTKTIKSTIEGLIKPDTEATKLRCRGPRERERELSHRHHLDPKPYTAGAGAGYTPARSLSQAPGARGAPGQAAAAGLSSCIYRRVHQASSSVLAAGHSSWSWRKAFCFCDGFLSRVDTRLPAPSPPAPTPAAAAASAWPSSPRLRLEQLAAAEARAGATRK